MATVRAGKFMMRILTWAMLADGKNNESIKKKVFKGITAVEGTDKEFKEINSLLRRYPVFPHFEIRKIEE